MKIRQQWPTQKGFWAAIAIFPTVVISFAKNDQRSSAPTHSETVRQIKAERVSERSVEPIRPLIKQTDLNREKVQLSKILFHETSLSADGSLSCASCHDVGNGGDDGLETSIGINHQIGPNNSPTILNSVFNANFFWDGRSISLERQLLDTVPHWDLQSAPLDTCQKIVRFMREAIARREDFDLEIVNYHKNGTPYWLGIEVRRIVHQTGNVVKFIAIVALPLNPRVPHARGRIVTNVGFWKLGVFPNR